MSAESITYRIKPDNCCVLDSFHCLKLQMICKHVSGALKFSVRHGNGHGNPVKICCTCSFHL